jgi:D-lactate dehydrogenase (cytochrome)
MITCDDITNLRAMVGEPSVSTGDSILKLHSHDESYRSPVLPDAVLWPHSSDEVSRVVRYAFKRRIPITAWGVGTSLEGNPIPASMYSMRDSGKKFRDLDQARRIFFL